jgi:predicted nucleotidyltransferase
MDLSRPIEALIPGARGEILGAMICAGRELSTADVGRLSRVSGPQASRVLAQLVGLGIVERREVPPAVLYKPVEGNVVVQLLVDLCNARDRVFFFAAERAKLISPEPIHVAVYGSVAAGVSGPDSDLDVLVVRPAGAQDGDSWVQSLDQWRVELQRFAGLPVSVLELGESEWRDLDVIDRPFWDEVLRNQIVLSWRTHEVA